MSTSPRSTGSNPSWLLAAALVLTALIYAPALTSDFTMDDRAAAMGIDASRAPHPMVYRLQPVWDYFTSHYWRGTEPVSDLYRPVTVLTFALSHALFGDNALVAHLINLLLHLLNVMLLHRLLRHLSAPAAAAALGASVFALHAIHSEAVIGIVGRAELLAFGFGIAAVLQAQKKSLMAMVSAPVLLWLAFCSKESGVAFAPLVLVVRVAIGRQAQRSLWIAVIQVLVPLAAFALLRYQMLAAQVDPIRAVDFLVNPLVALSAGERVVAATVILGCGLWQCLLPIFPFADYGFDMLPVVKEISDWRFLLAATALLLLALLGAVVGLRSRWFALTALTFFLFTFVISNLVFTIGTIFAERLYYTPSLVLSFAVVGFARGSTRIGQRALWMTVAAWSVMCGFVILTRTGDWQDDRTLFLSEVRRGTRSVRILIAAADLHLQDVNAHLRDSARAADSMRQAISLIDSAIEIDPEYVRAYNRRFTVLSVKAPALASFSDHAAAERSARRALQCRHGAAEDHAEAHANLAALYKHTGRPERATAEYLQAVGLNRADTASFRALLSEIDAGRMKSQQLQQFLSERRESQPRQGEWAGYLGVLAAHMGRHDQAVVLLEEALQNMSTDRFSGLAGAQFRFALADAWIATGKSGRVAPLLREYADQDLRPDLKQAALARLQQAGR